MTNTGAVEVAEINDISCEIRQKRWNSGERATTTVLQHWGGHHKDELKGERKTKGNF